MLYITKDGHVDAGSKVKLRIFTSLENGPLGKINGIVVHQTGGATAEGAFSSYRQPKANGAHFLIDRDGQIYQTASLYRVTNHVGLLRSRCIETHACSPAELKAAGQVRGVKSLSSFEQQKAFPRRFPSNADAIGIEIVGKTVSGEGENAIYEPINDRQNDSLRWLVRELAYTLGVSMNEVYRHPQVSYKVKSEAETAKW